MDRRAHDELSLLMARLKDGDRAAIRPAYERLWPAVVERCARTLGPGPDAEDAAQEAIVKVLAAAHAYDAARPAWPWVAAIATWEARTVARRRGRAREVYDDDAAEKAASKAPSPEDRCARFEVERAAARAIAVLAEPDHRALHAVLDGGGAMDDAARKRKSRAVQRLRSFWRDLR